MRDFLKKKKNKDPLQFSLPFLRRWRLSVFGAVIRHMYRTLQDQILKRREEGEAANLEKEEGMKIK